MHYWDTHEVFEHTMSNFLPTGSLFEHDCTNEEEMLTKIATTEDEFNFCNAIENDSNHPAKF